MHASGGWRADSGLLLMVAVGGGSLLPFAPSSLIFYASFASIAVIHLLGLP